MKVKIMCLTIAGVDIPCPIEIDLDSEEVYLKTLSEISPEHNQCIKLDLKSQIEAQLVHRTDEKKGT
jgi:hypothetical protein